MARSITQYTTEHARKGRKSDAAGCKPKTCPRCGGQECIERPRFFCGQLLTDKDLDAAQRYVIEKNRLHNRYLVGKGVVCGLVVRCEPCDGESVVVEPGYAIDCCGNDVVVCDPEPFNVVEYIEKCFGPKKPDCDERIRVRRARCDEGPKEYCLLLSYAEELSQKATALVRDKGCQESRCEFSRVRETFRLDLVERSSLPKTGQPNLWTRIADCLPDTSRKMGLAAAEYYSLDFQGPQGRDAAERDLVRRVRRSVAELYRNGPNIRCNIEDLLCPPEEPACPTLRVDCPNSVDLRAPITFTADLEPEDPNITPTFNWTVSAGTITSGQGTRTLVVDTAGVGSGQGSENVTASVEVVGYPPECDLRGSCTTRVGGAAGAPTAAPIVVTQPRDETAVLGQILTPYFQYMIDCFCDALLVPCTPCAEPEGVVLACITVEDGKVVKICNVARTQLITGPALRYWLGPLFTGTHKLVEFLCCRLELKRFRRWTPALYRGVSSFLGSDKSVRFGRAGAGASVSLGDAFTRGRKVVASTARAAARVARTKLASVGGLRGAAAAAAGGEKMLGAEFYRLDAGEARAKLERMNVNVVEERVAATPEEADTVANLKSMVNVISPRATVEIVKDAQNRVVAVRARSGATKEEATGGAAKEDTGGASKDDKQ